MFSLNTEYYPKQWKHLHDLIQDVIQTGMDPNYEITKDGIGIGETAADHIIP